MMALAMTQEPMVPETSDRRAVFGQQLDVLADIYQEEVNLATWQRELPTALVEATGKILLAKPKLQVSLVLGPKAAYENLVAGLGTEPEAQVLATDIAELVDMLCYLFELKQVGLRLSALGHAMCPRFHVDRVPCRLVSTYIGSATEWLPHDRIDRSKLGGGRDRMPDGDSGLYASSPDIQHLKAGAVALLKGESWEGNEGAGLVHRSPQLAKGACRLLLTLDFVN